MIYLKPKVTLQRVFICFTDFCWVKFKNPFNDMKEQSFVHMIHICCALFVIHIIKRVSLLQKGSESKVMI